MVRTCCVIGCTNKSHDGRGRKMDNGLRFFTFPTWKKTQGPQVGEISKRRRMAWVAAVRRKDITFDKITPFMFVCSGHFHKGKPAYEMMENDPDWAPSLHMGHTEHKRSEAACFSQKSKPALWRDHLQERQHEPSDDAKPWTPEDEQCKEEVTRTVKEEQYEMVIQEIKEEEEQIECNVEGKEEIIKQVDEPIECNFCILRASEVNRLVEENKRLKRELDAFKMSDGFFGEDDDDKVEYYTGLPSVGCFTALFQFLLPLMPAQESGLSPFQVLLLTLMRLRLDLPARHLSYMFSVATSTVDRTFKDTVSFLYAQLRRWITWPNRDTLQRTTPRQFAEAFGGKGVVIVACLKMLAQKTLHQNERTVKYLIAITPSGFVSFVSKGWHSVTSEKTMLEKSGFLNKLLPGDVVLADFDSKKDSGLLCAEVQRPAFPDVHCQLAARNLDEMAQVRTHVEKVLVSIRHKYKLLQGDVPVNMMLACDGEEVTFLDKIVIVCYALTNYCPTVV
ncbi:uncharacterized protein LOC129195083 [Dunckerocampus dactyliophorus]|uniref:uncharacterized protein LOC129195083 n=1 Tax=Dunckerocampus dactyliophorus TaxID=161453 RepID=UPI00240583F4|nr:uncharacterized protein LOC129195083 [Dunckerocampus dactyliophorus]